MKPRTNYSDMGPGWVGTLGDGYYIQVGLENIFHLINHGYTIFYKKQSGPSPWVRIDKNGEVCDVYTGKNYSSYKLWYPGINPEIFDFSYGI